MQYRPDVDGLRAAAVVPVVLFHAGVPGFGGGFVGVDVFFVISGTLITGLIAEEIRQGRFSLADFYERRIRRIVPALAAMLLFCAVAASVLLLPMDHAEFGRSVVAAALSFSNVFFWRQSGYFSDAAELKPLLHTWSLSVEEQFYIALPLFLLAMTALFRGRWAGRWITGGVLVMMAASFALSVEGLERHPDAVFYLMPTRAWELLLGALLGLGAVPAVRNAWVNEAAGLLGLGLIVWAVVLFDRMTAFPGANALVPCLGAALVIHAGGGAGIGGGRPLAARLLALPVPVFIGLISYSLYLWHWPLLVFAHYTTFGPLDPIGTAGVLALAVLVSVLSWRFVEKPFRTGPWLRGRRAFVHGAAALALFLAFGGGSVASDGWAARFDPQVRRVEALADSRNTDYVACKDRDPAHVRNGDLCTVGATETRGEPWLIWGDSHAWAMLHLFDEAFRQAGARAIVASYDGCVPLFDVGRVHYQGPCRAIADSVERLIEREGIRKVVMTAYWTGYYRDTLQVDDHVIGPGNPAVTAQVLNRGLVRTVDRLAGRGIAVYLTDPLPGGRWSVPRALAAAAAWNRPIDPAYSLDEYRAMNRDFFQTVESLGDEIRGRLSLWTILCDGGRCRTETDGLPLYFDTNHPARATFGFAQGPVTAFIRGGTSVAAAAGDSGRGGGVP